jgi:methyltransferase (TIGR00027 family)
VDHCEMRSLSIDAVAREALNGGATQLVILGAGLDARAWRLPEAGRARTFEVDHPATQRYKRARAGRATGELHFVPVDFERDSLDARLAEAGHDAAARTMWIWEGVTPYLPLEATRATLGVVAARSARGSTLAMTYARPEMSNLPAATKPFIRGAFALAGEPLRGLVTTDALRAMVESVAMLLEDDSGMDEWVARYRPSHAVPIRLAERLAVCRKTG